MNIPHCDVCDTHPADSDKRLWLGENDKPFDDPEMNRMAKNVFIDVNIKVSESQRAGIPQHLCRRCWKLILGMMVAKMP